MRLLEVGVPATVEHAPAAGPGEAQVPSARLVAEAVQVFTLQ